MGNGVRKVRRFAAKSSDALWLEVFNMYWASHRWRGLMGADNCKY